MGLAPRSEPTQPRRRPPRPEPIRRPVADWIEAVCENYPGRVDLLVMVLPALPFLLAAGVPFARAHAGQLITAAVMLCVGSLGLRWRRGVLDRQAAERARTHTCPVCGYDLRATPYVCPECGTFATPPPGWRVPHFVRAEEVPAGPSDG